MNLELIAPHETVSGKQFLEQLRKYPCYAGLDLAAVTDLTAFVLAWEVNTTVYAYPWFFLPMDDIDERSKRDGVPYRQWWEQGYLHLTEGSVTDWRYVVTLVKEIAKEFKLREVAFDPYGARDVVRELADGGISCLDVSQSITSLTAPTKRLQELVLSKKLVHTGHPLLRWNFDCSSIYSDPNGNIKVFKPDRRKSSKHVDGVVALIMAISRLQNTEKKGPSVYLSRGVRTL
jgi:phage terminase large subunit-like protein